MGASVWVDGDVPSALSAQLSLASDKAQTSCEGSHTTVTGTRKIRTGNWQRCLRPHGWHDRVGTLWAPVFKAPLLSLSPLGD